MCRVNSYKANYRHSRGRKTNTIIMADMGGETHNSEKVNKQKDEEKYTKKHN
jgi:hypothetical protein